LAILTPAAEDEVVAPVQDSPDSPDMDVVSLDLSLSPASPVGRMVDVPDMNMAPLDVTSDYFTAQIRPPDVEDDDDDEEVQVLRGANRINKAPRRYTVVNSVADAAAAKEAADDVSVYVSMECTRRATDPGTSNKDGNPQPGTSSTSQGGRTNQRKRPRNCHDQRNKITKLGQCSGAPDPDQLDVLLHSLTEWNSKYATSAQDLKNAVQKRKHVEKNELVGRGKESRCIHKDKVDPTIIDRQSSQILLAVKMLNASAAKEEIERANRSAREIERTIEIDQELLLQRTSMKEVLDNQNALMTGMGLLGRRMLQMNSYLQERQNPKRPPSATKRRSLEF
jgi:hypothetical protein